MHTQRVVTETLAGPHLHSVESCPEKASLAPRILPWGAAEGAQLEGMVGLERHSEAQGCSNAHPQELPAVVGGVAVWEGPQMLAASQGLACYRQEWRPFPGEGNWELQQRPLSDGRVGGELHLEHLVVVSTWLPEEEQLLEYPVERPTRSRDSPHIVGPPGQKRVPYDCSVLPPYHVSLGPAWDLRCLGLPPTVRVCLA